MISIEYTVLDAGWAIIEISNGDKNVKICASYLHDSLKDLAESAIEIQYKKAKYIVFMDEPGEHQLLLKLNNNEIEFTLIWYEQWASSHLTGPEKCIEILKGKTTLTKYINEVRRNLLKIYNTLGEKGYLEKWCKHEFPLDEYLKLK